MSARTNEFGQSIGSSAPDWTTRPLPPRTPMSGRFVRVAPLDPEAHAQQLYEAFAIDDGRMWTYMPSYAAFDESEGLAGWAASVALSDDPQFYAIVDRHTERAVGFAGYLRIAPDTGSIEVGNIAFSPLLQRTPVATEAMYLMMRRVFDELAYRRYEWKCDALNERSRRAAERFGFTFDGVFEQALVYKGRNRDTAWYSVLDRVWPRLRSAFETWLDAENFDAQGRQRLRLRVLVDRAGDQR